MSELTTDQQNAVYKLQLISAELKAQGLDKCHTNLQDGSNLHVKWFIDYPKKCLTHEYWQKYFTEKECGRYCPDCGELLIQE